MNPRTTRRSALAVFLFVALSCLAGCSKGGAQATSSSGAPPAGSAAAVAGRVVPVTVGEGGFAPSTIPAAKGEDLVLRFTRKVDSDCLKAVELPSLGIQKELPLNTPVDVPVKADKEGKIGFECWMHMYKGNVVVGAPK
jgi:plastocyanin domain-containing protein